MIKRFSKLKKILMVLFLINYKINPICFFVIQCCLFAYFQCIHSCKTLENKSKINLFFFYGISTLLHKYVLTKIALIKQRKHYFLHTYVRLDGTTDIRTDPSCIIFESTEYPAQP